MFKRYQGQLLLADILTGHHKPSVEWGGGLFKSLPAPEFCPAFARSITVMVNEQTFPGCIHPGSRGCCAPVFSRKQTMGMLRLIKNAGENDDSAMAGTGLLGLVSVVAENLALSLDNLRMRNIFEAASMRDHLTRLYNRRYMEDFMLQAMSRTKRTGKGLGLILLDVDQFKEFNDQWRHFAGDEVLKGIGKILLESLRDGDVPCRSGGEEFLLVLPDCSYEDALKKADDLRREILKLELKSDSGQRLKVTVSGGVAAFPGHGDNYRELYEKADQSLYRAKKTGRNRILGCDEKNL